MEHLRCIMADHETEGNPIIGICVDKKCKATQRIFCLTCLKKQHDTCQRDSYLNKQQILIKLMNKIEDQNRQRPFYLLRTLRAQINNACDQLEKDFQIQENNQKTMSSGRIQQLSKVPFTMDIWNQCYLELENNEPKPQLDKYIIGYFNQIQQLLQNLINVTQILQTDWIQRPVSKVPVNQIYQKSIIHMNGLQSIDCSPCGKFLACSNDSKFIKLDSNTQKRIAQTNKLHTNNILVVKYSPNGSLIASGSIDQTIIIWDASTLKQVGEALQHESYVYCISFSPDNLHLLSGSYDKTIRIWSIQNQEQVGEMVEVDYFICSVEYSNDGLYFLSSGGSQFIDIWEVKSRSRIIQLKGHKVSYLRASYSQTGKYIVSSSKLERIIKVWDATTGQQIGNDFVGHKNPITSVTFSPDLQWIASGSEDRTVRLWNFKTGEQEAILHTHNNPVSAVNFSKDGKYVISGSLDRTICKIRVRND